MSSFFLILMGLAMAAVVASLFAGVVTMVRGGSSDARNGNRLMRYRVLLQGIALALFALAMLTNGN
jgi:high-affinity Fe2+/Pb2+ permease